MAAEAQLLARQQAPPWEPTGVIGTVIGVIGTDIIFIIGAAVVAGSAHQMEDHIRYRIDIAADVARSLDQGLKKRAAPPWIRRTAGNQKAAPRLRSFANTAVI